MVPSLYKLLKAFVMGILDKRNVVVMETFEMTSLLLIFYFFRMIDLSKPSEVRDKNEQFQQGRKMLLTKKK